MKKKVYISGAIAHYDLKERMATFERYFIDDKETHEEPKNAYYRLFEKEEIVDKILKEFGLPVKGAHIINGHIPVIVKKGESPVKCVGKLLIIDGANIPANA